MKYMGSKSVLLGGELGEILLQECSTASRFVDLFAGSGAVAHFIAQRADLPVLAIDLQEYSRIFSAAIIERTASLAGDAILRAWLANAPASEVGARGCVQLTAGDVIAERERANSALEGFVVRHYGGHYFSLEQARTLDALYASLPSSAPHRTVALSALLHSASDCAAAPGHTAQPFQPTETLLPFIGKAWSRSIAGAAENALQRIASSFAVVKGEAHVGDAQLAVRMVDEGDLVFCDPPYSSVQYSRFYHVLEGISRGGWAAVSGRGRAPARTSRATSDFSMKSRALSAMDDLLTALHKRRCRVLITFPDAGTSNGLSCNDITALATDKWFIRTRYVDSVHSTLGGGRDGSRRGGRKKLREAVIVLYPRPNVQKIALTASVKHEHGIPFRGVAAAG